MTRARSLALLVALGLLTSTMFATPASAGWRMHRCRFQYLDGAPGWNQHEVRRTIGCGVEHFTVPGGLTMALCIARRESGFRQYADNPTSSASGVYQFVDGTWASVSSAFPLFWREWGLSRSVWNARANVLGAIQVAHRWGWGAWGGGC